MRTRLPQIEIILPVYNEVNNILPLVKQLDMAAQNLRTRALVSYVGSSRVDLQACKLEYSIVSPK